MDILSIGEILIDLTQTGVNAKGVPLYAANPGGAPANLSVAAARLGGHLVLVSRLVLVSHLVLVSPQVYDLASHLEPVSL